MGPSRFVLLLFVKCTYILSKSSILFLFVYLKGSKDIGHGIYCKGEALTQALTSSTNVNHVLRRVMSGVFNPAEILNCTVTGKSWNAGGPDHKGKEMTALHPTALQAIFGK